MKITLLLTAVMVFGEVALAQPLNDLYSPISRTAESQSSLFSADTTDTAGVVQTGEEGDRLPLAANPVKLTRPRFEVIHLVLGIGGMMSDFSDLNTLDVDENNLSIPFLVYIYLPFQREDPSFYFTGGWEMGIGGGRTSFKGLLLYQNPKNILIGVGFGRTWFSYDGDDVVIDASQSYPLLAVGANVDPQRVDLLLTIPVTSSLQTNFEGSSYHVRPAGIQLSLLISIRT